MMIPITGPPIPPALKMELERALSRRYPQWSVVGILFLDGPLSVGMDGRGWFRGNAEVAMERNGDTHFATLSLEIAWGSRCR